MNRLFLVSALFAVSAAFQAPVMPSKLGMSNVVMQHDGKGFGGGEATRDPAPTYVDPNDPKGKQQAIHKAESFADYLARRSGGAAAPAPAPAPAAYAAPAAAPAPAAYAPPAPVASSVPHDGKGFGGGEATRDPAPTFVDPNDPKGKQQAIHKAESFADYLARRGGAAAAPAPAAYEAPAAAPAPAAYAPPAPAASFDNEDSAKRAWLSKLDGRGQWSQSGASGNVVPTQPVYEAAPAAAPSAPAQVEATGSALFAQYLAQRA